MPGLDASSKAKPSALRSFPLNFNPAILRSVFSRVTSSGRFIPAVDGLRFVAILSVVLYHLNGFVLAKCPAITLSDAKGQWLQRVLDVGNCGVQLFFVISGFILGLPFAEHYLLGRRKPSLRQYFKRRVLRIEPPYVINLLIIYALKVLTTPAGALVLLPSLAASLCYANNLVFGEMSRVNGIAWSLEIEVQFYILAPFLAAVFAVPGQRLRRGGLVGGILLLIGVKMVFPGHLQPYAGATVVACLDYFLAGFLLADLYLANGGGVDQGEPCPSRLRMSPRTLVWDVIGLVAWCAVVAVHFHERTQPLLPLAILLAYLGVFRGTLLQRCFSCPWIATIGGMCYTIYLYHFFIISAVGRWTIGCSLGRQHGSNLALQALLILPCVLVVSAVLFLLFEKPFMVRDWPASWRSAALKWLHKEKWTADPSSESSVSQSAAEA